MAAAGSEKRGAFRKLLTTDIRETRRREQFLRRILIVRGLRERVPSRQEIQKFLKCRDTVAVDPFDHTSFPEIAAGQEAAFQSCVTGSADHSDDAVDRKDLPAEGKLSDQKRVFRESIRQIPVGAQKRGRDRKIIGASFLPDVSGGETDGDVTGFQMEPGVRDRGAHPVRRLPYRL